MAEGLLFALSCRTCNSSNATMSLLPSQSPISFRRPHRQQEHHYIWSSSSSSSSVPSCSSSSYASRLLLQTSSSIFVPRAASASGETSRITCLFGGGNRDAARRALESALGEKKDVFTKWDEEIKKREATGGGGPPKGRGRGWGGGGGGDKDEGDNLSNSSESGFQFGEALQVVYAFAGLAGLYLVLTQGNRMLALVLNAILFVSRGFKPAPKTIYAPVGNQLPGGAESHVRSKWGSDD